MGAGDLFLLDTAIDDHKQEERVESYKNNKFINEWLIYIPLQLGLSKEDVEFDVRFRNSRIEAYYIIKNDKELVFNEKKLEFKKGDQLIVVVAYKHDAKNLKKYCKLHFDKVSFWASDDNSKALVLCEV
jgi:hypothetical protein